ncbi:hypothetical protein QZH41_002827 [Actinostola sp. cb2023]|nr:hypothetical protein QZH41_002827 [Actinostola sp. cb2023]
MLLVVMDASTKWPEIFLMKNTTAEETVSTLRTLLARMGLSEQIVSDNGPQFTSEVFKRFVQSNGIHHVMGAPYHPSTNGLAERLVQSFKRAVKADLTDRDLQHKLDRFLMATAAKNDFEKDFFKLMNNSVFGKTMENIRNRQDIKLVTTEKQAAKLISQPNYYRRTIFSEHLCAIHMIKTELVFNKPVYLGMAILDLSKALMYDFHYNYFKKKFRNTSALLFTDTDSLMYEIESEDFYKDIQDDIVSRFDTSAYPKDHPIGKWTNKKVIGMMKDETAAEGEITEFVGLRSKLYAYKIEDKEEKKCKGIKKSVVKKDLEFDDYKNCLFSGVKVMRKMNVIRSYKHQLFSETVNKVALSREDDKRNILTDQIHTHSI